MGKEKIGFAATIGFFDGVHRGHAFLLRQLKELASERGLQPMAITFSRHPREVVDSSYVPSLLSSTEEKTAAIRSFGVDEVVVLDFDSDMSRLSAYEFMETVLRDSLGVSLLLTGYDNHFGHRTRPDEGFDDYAAYGRRLGIEVARAQPLTIAASEIGGDSAATIAVSSSLVRRRLNDGDVAAATVLLSHPYSICGTVVGGEQIGRKIGFPTANISITDTRRLTPKAGVYAVKANGRPAMMNIGTRPTFGGTGQTLEVHLLDFSGDLYGKCLTVEFVARLRDEKHFASADELRLQLQRDADAAKAVFSDSK